MSSTFPLITVETFSGTFGGVFFGETSSDVIEEGCSMVETFTGILEGVFLGETSSGFTGSPGGNLSSLMRETFSGTFRGTSSDTTDEEMSRAGDFWDVSEVVLVGGTSSDVGFSGSAEGRLCFSSTSVETFSGLLPETVSALTGGRVSGSNGGTLFIMTHPSDSYM